MQPASETATYGVTQRDTSRDPLDVHCEELRRNGFTVLPGVYSAEQLEPLRRTLDNLLRLQVEESGGQEAVARARDADLVRCPLAYDEALLAFACEPSAVAIAKRLLGDNIVLLMQNAVINRPQKRQEQSQYHRDLNYQHWTVSRPIALNYLICVDRFFKEGGATWVLPGSHLHESFPSSGYVARNEVAIEAEPGTIVMMDAMLFHRSGVNQTSDYVRRAINHVVGAPLLAQQIDIPRLLRSRGRDYSTDDFLSRFLGYRWNPAADVREWRGKHAAP